MASDTPLAYQNLVLYEVYVRQHGPTGTFRDVEDDLERIRSLGVDVIWFMPIHPIGSVARKGSLGSPYSIANYREVNPEYGTKDDFARLLEKAHGLGMKVLIDVVYNHTAHDSIFVREYPDWYHQDRSGRPVTSVPAWSDIIDLKYPNPGLETYLIETLAGWVQFGVDGFRCDVASLVPVDFWLRARRRCAEINPNTLWLAESVHAGFVGARRDAHLRAYPDAEIFQAFDMAYDYDIWPIWQAAVTGQTPVARYLEMVRFQYCIYPQNHVKMRCVENHDQARILNLAPSREQALAWTAFMAFNRGSWMIYAGQESAAVHTPSHFDKDPIIWGDYELSPFLSALARVKKEQVLSAGNFTIPAVEPCIVATWELAEDSLLGVFNVQGSSGRLTLPLPDGDYPDLISGKNVPVRQGQAPVPAVAYVLRPPAPVNAPWFYSLLIDLHIPRDSE